MYLSRPKFLLVFYQKAKAFAPIKIALYYARLFQQVDFLVVQAIQNKQSIVFRINFVTGKIEIQSKISSSSKLFPDNINPPVQSDEISRQKYSMISQNLHKFKGPKGPQIKA